MSKSRKSFKGIIFLILIATLCLGISLLLIGYMELNRRTEAAFGSPKPTLDPLQKVRFSLQLLYLSDQLLESADPAGDAVPFGIELGESPIAIAARLESTGIIPYADAFITYLKYSGLDTSLQAGDYSLSPSATAVELAHILQDATPSEVTLSILPGWRMEEITATLPTSGLEITRDKFLAAANSPTQAGLLSIEFPAEGSLEGFLSPGSYRIPRQTSADQLIRILLEAFISGLTVDILDGFQAQGLDVFQAVTLASIVEREAVVAEEMPMIASVFLNRLAIGMALEADSTVQYARGFNQEQNTWWTNPLSNRDLQFDSPYNTYLYSGLPPGPIANPGRRALRAMAFPAQSPYYYFRATCDGSGKHTFSETFDEHLSKACP
jgi:UPF0755 protein